MKPATPLALITLVVLSCAGALPGGQALAQDKQRVSYKVAAENTKYLQRHILEVGDQPGHQVGLFEIHRIFPTDAPVINGVKLKESWSRGVNDYVNGNGTSTNYSIYVLEDGDRFFTVSTTMGHVDAAGKRTTTGVGHIIGGTGKLVGMQGLLRTSGVSDAKVGLNEQQVELEYWFAK